MTTLQVQSTLVDDVFPHQAVATGGDVAITQDSSGLLTIFSVGTNGRVYRVAPDGDSETGWKISDLDCPEPIDVIAATMDDQRNLVVCGANQKSRKVYALLIGPGGCTGAWKTINPGPDITGSLTFYELKLRVTAAGAVEFFLLYFQRMSDPQWHYTYRIGRAMVTADAWTIGFNLDNLLYTGPQPVDLPSMTLGQASGLPTLFLYWHEAEKIRAWKGLDGSPTVEDREVPGQSVIRSLFALGDSDSILYAAGSIGPATTPGLYRWGAASEFVLLSGSSPIAAASGVYSANSGYDILAVGPTGLLYHVHGSPDGARWTPFSPMGDRVTAVVGASTPDAGNIFIATTVDRTLRHYYRDPQEADWQVEEVDVPAGTAEQVVWYTTKVSVLDEDSRAINGVQVVVSCAEATEVLINGKPDLVGPGRTAIFETGVVGNLLIQQSTSQLSNLYVPRLKLDLLTGQSSTLEPYADVRDRLYRLTGAELKDAKSRSGNPVLPASQQGDAGKIARTVAIGASLGLPPPPGVNLHRWEDLGSPPPGLVRFKPADSNEWIDLGIDIGDLFEGIKESIFGAFSAVLTAVGDHVVTGLNLVISTAQGAYAVFLATMEHAFDAIRTVFESVGAIFQDVLEWLGKLFDWEAIKALAGSVKSMMVEGMGSIPRMLEMAKLPGEIGPIFDGFRQQASGALDYIRQQIGTSSAGAAARTAGFSNSDSVFDFGGKSYGNEANWLLDRLTPQLGGAIFEFGLGNPGWRGFEQVWTSIAQSFLETGEAIANNFIALFQNLVTSADVLSTAMNSILDQLQALVDGVLSALEGIVSGLVGALQTLASSTALGDLMNTPIKIPVISDILAAVGLGGVTILDLLSYLVAIPMHVVNTIIGTPVPAATLAATPVGVFLALGIMFFVIMVLTAVNDALPEGKVVLAVLPSLVWVAAAALVFFGVAKAAAPPPELIIAAILYLGYQVVGLRVNALYFGHPSAVRKFAIYSIVDAVVMNVLAAIWAIRTSQDPDPNNRPKPWQITANHVGTLTDIFRWSDLVWPPPNPKPLPARLMMVGVDVVGMGALTAGAITDYVYALREQDRESSARGV
ncbi:MAG: hypothetical protein KF823_11395 [Xanthomonadales bacterium]|nr:hypothetical protein [Xanthomonadales bacterium]